MPSHNWVISSCWVRISHGSHSTTGLFHAAHTGLFRHAGFESHTVAIAQLGYFMQHTTGLFRHAGFESHTVAIAQLGYFMRSTQLGYFMKLGYFVMLGSNLTRWP